MSHALIAELARRFLQDRPLKRNAAEDSSATPSADGSQRTVKKPRHSANDTAARVLAASASHPIEFVIRVRYFPNNPQSTAVLSITEAEDAVPVTASG